MRILDSCTHVEKFKSSIITPKNVGYIGNFYIMFCSSMNASVNFGTPHLSRSKIAVEH